MKGMNKQIKNPKEQITKWLAASPPPAPLLLTSSDATALGAALAEVRSAAPEQLTVAADEKTMTIKSIRAALEASQHTSLAGGRVVIIEEAAKLTAPAANALLKMLEEPSTATRWLLATRWPRRLLPTIRSRCELVRLPALPAQEEVATPALLTQPLLERLASRQGDSFTTEELRALSHTLGSILRQHGPSPELKRALMRLRDYHFIAAQRGNTKLAQDVLLASLPEPIV